MPNWEDLQRQLAGLTQQERNQLVAKAVKSGEIYPEKYGEQIRQEAPPEQMTISAGPPIITDAQAEPQYTDIAKRMQENYKKSPQYRQLLEQELSQISAQIDQLTQRRNLIEMAIKGQG